MNLEEIDDGYLLFMSDIGCLDKDNLIEDNISIFIKDIFIILDDVYNIELSGYYKLDIYIDFLIGAYIEIKRIDDYISYNKKIDTKVNMLVTDFYLKTKDLEKIYNYRPIYTLDNMYCVSSSDIDDIDNLIEFCDIEYKDRDLKIVLI